MDIELILTLIGVLISFINVFGIALVGLYLTSKARKTKVIDKIFTLYRELRKLKSEERPDLNDLADLQLQIKHLMLEIMNAQKWSFVKLTQSQNRIMADCCEEFLYYNKANDYWIKCFAKTFQLIEIESEYHRRYAQFLYSIDEFAKGDAEYNKALELPNDNDGRIYINIESYCSWIQCIMDKAYELKPSLSKEKYKEINSLIKKLLHQVRKLARNIKDIPMSHTAENKIEDVNKNFVSFFVENS